MKYVLYADKNDKKSHKAFQKYVKQLTEEKNAHIHMEKNKKRLIMLLQIDLMLCLFLLFLSWLI